MMAAHPPSARGCAAITGIAKSKVGRRLGRSGLDLTLEACLAAIDDAGLTPADIDGLSTYPGWYQLTPGFSGAGITDVKNALRLQLNWYSGGFEVPGQLGAVFNACGAISIGLARHVLCFRTVNETTESARQQVRSTQFGTPESGIDGQWSWQVPFRAPAGVAWMAMIAARHFYQYGTTREQLAQVALNSRRNAQDNPAAVYRTPLTLDDYLNARMMSTPLCLYDCDVPVDGSTAFVVSVPEAAVDAPRPPVFVEAIGAAHTGHDSWDQRDDLASTAAYDAGAALWQRTDFSPADVDVAELYDGFSFMTLQFLEGMGFCGKGEGGAFVEDGQRISRTGDLPINTDGGQLSAGRLHGWGQLYEACSQLRGHADVRQIQGAQVAAVGVGAGPVAGCMLLRNI